jgi:hypothetical protein
MLPSVLTRSFLLENKESLFKFIEWFNTHNKQEETQVSIEVFFDLDFAVQLGFYIEWLTHNGVYIVSQNNPITRSLCLRLVYTKKPNVEFRYHDLDEVDTQHFVHNPLEAYEVLIAMFLIRLKFPF